MRSTEINGRWPLLLPEHRAVFHEERPWWEAARLSDMYAHLAEGQSIIDVGSEEGDFTALYASWGCQVSFIDPSEPWITQTQQIFEENRLTYGPFFIGFAGAETRQGDRSQTRGFHNLDERPDLSVITLDDFTAWQDRKPDAVTMDVEGSELEVLQGASLLLDEDVVWWISVHDCDPHAATPSKVHVLMRERGFKDQWLGSLGEHHYRFFK